MRYDVVYEPVQKTVCKPISAVVLCEQRKSCENLNKFFQQLDGEASEMLLETQVVRTTCLLDELYW